MLRKSDDLPPKLVWIEAKNFGGWGCSHSRLSRDNLEHAIDYPEYQPVFSFEQTLHLLMLNIVCEINAALKGHAVPHMKRWLGLYKAALLELDVQQMPKRIVVARTALQERLRNLQSGSGDYVEELEIGYAFRNLCVAERMAGMEAKRR